MGIAITKVTLSKQTVTIKSALKITVAAKEIAAEPNTYRLPFKLGQEKGGIK